MFIIYTSICSRVLRPQPRRIYNLSICVSLLAAWSSGCAVLINRAWLVLYVKYYIIIFTFCNSLIFFKRKLNNFSKPVEYQIFRKSTCPEYFNYTTSLRLYGFGTYLQGQAPPRGAFPKRYVPKAYRRNNIIFDHTIKINVMSDQRL